MDRSFAGDTIQSTEVSFTHLLVHLSPTLFAQLFSQCILLFPKLNQLLKDEEMCSMANNEKLHPRSINREKKMIY